jgi:hypothetical protein
MSFPCPLTRRGFRTKWKRPSGRLFRPGLNLMVCDGSPINSEPRIAALGHPRKNVPFTEPPGCSLKPELARIPKSLGTVTHRTSGQTVPGMVGERAVQPESEPASWGSRKNAPRRLTRSGLRLAAAGDPSTRIAHRRDLARRTRALSKAENRSIWLTAGFSLGSDHGRRKRVEVSPQLAISAGICRSGG